MGRRSPGKYPRPVLRDGGALLASILLVVSVLEAAEAPDRLDRFRQLAATRLSVAQILDPETASDAYREAYALLDDEVVESLASGGVFASTDFLQDRLDAFGEVWGAASVRVVRIGPFLVGAFHLSDGLTGNSVRVYGRNRGDVELLAAIAREGRPSVYPVGTVGQAASPFVVAWEGAATGRGTRALRLDLLRWEDDRVRAAWSTADVFPDGLYARTFRVTRADVRLRYELHYPGWTPGCDGQTEQEDLYRLAPGGTTFTRANRQQFNVWHRDLRQSVSRFFAAMEVGDRTAIASLVPDARLRERLPSGLRPETACDAPDQRNPDAVSVAAVAANAPWQLTFRRAGPAWRLSAAAPVIQ